MQLLRQTIPLVVLLATATCLFAATPATEPTVKPEDLPRVPPTEPADALKKFSIRPGFEAQLVATEPDVIDPIALCFDEDSRMYVVEMRDYSERREERLGRIRMLEDVDGDGRYEKSTVFLENLAWPTAVFYSNGGVLVGASPDIIYAKDTNGDGVADETKKLFTGFGATQEKLNVQGLFNNFIWGLDNRIHGCSGTNGGLVQRVPANGSQAAPPRDPSALDVRGKGFLIDPRTWSMTTENGGGQYGLSFNHVGQLFTCSNSVHIETFMYDARYAGRNPYATLPDPRICPAVDGPAAEVFRTSPEEPWRVIRTRWRVAGLVPGMIEGGGRSAGYFTGATGVTIYRGDAFGADFVGDAFTGDAGGNLVHRKKLRPGADGIEPVAERPADEKKIEFLSSSDNWFRPVDFANTPDGTLFVCDMYRETIEHPWSIPPSIKQFLDLNSGNDRGRIWRVAPDGFKPRPAPKLSKATTAELIALLEHPNGWHREIASRLIFERNDKSALAPLKKLLRESRSPLGRMHAMYALHGFAAFDVDDVIIAMADADPVVRAHAIQLSEASPPADVIAEKLAALADDPDPRVRYQLAWSLETLRPPLRTPILTKLAQRDATSRWMRAAILNSLETGAGEVFAALASDPTSATQALLEPLAEMIGAKHDEIEVKVVVAAMKSSPKPFTLARALADGATRGGAQDQVKSWLGDVIEQAAAVAQDATARPADRAAAVSLLAYAGNTDRLLALLADRAPSVQLAALNALDRADAPQLASDVISHFAKFSPRVQSEAVTVLLKRPARAKALLEAIRDKRIAANALNSTQVALLHNHRDAAVKKLAKEVLAALASRDAVVESFRAATSMTGDAARGKLVYQKLCVSCHRADGEGHALGPDFVTVRNSGREKLLLSILDPNREVQPNFIGYLVETRDGSSVLGVLASDTPAAITIREAYGKETVIPRANIKRMTSQGKSIMPEGLEQGLKQQDVADLMTFVEQAR
jgi:putative membrane-bound dehydrogenase-like protein